MSKVDIASMIAGKTATDAPADDKPAPKAERSAQASETQSSKARSKKAASKKTATKKSAARRPNPSDETQGPTSSNERPKWQQCEPQTIYMWPDHVDELKALAQQLQRAKGPGVGERITMATLVRVATAQLLDQRSQLDGTTESELLASLLKS